MMGKLGQRLKDASRSGVYRLTDTAAVLEATREAGLDAARIDAAHDAPASIARELDFPGWFGGNWDALEDCLGDLSWRPAPGHVLLFERFPRGDELAMLMDVLRSSAGFWAQRGRPFFALFADPGRELELPDLYREA